MRKFKKGGRKGTSRKKMMRKLASSAARQVGSFVLLSLMDLYAEYYYCIMR